jgi:hypothetical protein
MWRWWWLFKRSTQSTIDDKPNSAPLWKSDCFALGKSSGKAYGQSHCFANRQSNGIAH